MKRFTAQKSTNLTAFLQREYGSSISYGEICKLYRKKDIKVNGKRVSKNCEICVNDVIEVYFEQKTQEINLLFNDDNLLVAVKPVGIESQDFFEKVKAVYPEVIFTHRLDRNTSGIMLFAKNQPAYDQLFNGFKTRAFEKYYYCLVNGKMKSESGVLKDFLFKDSKRSTVMVSREKTKGSLPIETHYQVVKQGESSSLLKVKLITGRTHQIRAHLAFYGNFIIGDGKYGRENVNKLFKQKTQLLVSAETVLHFGEKSFLYYLDNKTFKIDVNYLFEKLK